MADGCRPCSTPLYACRAHGGQGDSNGAMNGIHRTCIAALVVCAVLAVPAGAMAQTPVVSVPLGLQVLEQKMAQIRVNTPRILVRFALGELGPAISGAELGTGVKSSNGFVSSSTGSFRISPP